MAKRWKTWLELGENMSLIKSLEYTRQSEPPFSQRSVSIKSIILLAYLSNLLQNFTIFSGFVQYVHYVFGTFKNTFTWKLHCLEIPLAKAFQTPRQPGERLECRKRTSFPPSLTDRFGISPKCRRNIWTGLISSSPPKFRRIACSIAGQVGTLGTTRASWAIL